MKDLTNENVIHIKKDGIEYLQFRKLLEYSKIITHAYSLGINKNFRTAKAKDAEPISKQEYEKAEKNYKELSEAIGIDYKNIVKPNQAHTKNIQKVENKINKEKPDFNLEKYNQTDGLITNKNEIILATTNADCILLIFFDPIKKVIANVHSGWKGTLQRISIETIEKMKKEYNSNPQDIICCMCPSIRKCHFEVQKDVKELFEKEFSDLEQIDEIIEKDENKEKWRIDTIKINKIILEKAGLKKENIIDSGLCSVCEAEQIHSFRVEKDGYGLNTAIVSLK